MDDTGRVRLGFFATAGAVIVASALAALRQERPRIQVTTREGNHPIARAGATHRRP